nr:hypothetical protein [uncultured Treponema sp.]
MREFKRIKITPQQVLKFFCWLLSFFCTTLQNTATDGHIQQGAAF